jgi:3-hydroxyisobutyrate dehydrogenase-like beta-hydroxyacid dehydrogenase
MAVETVAIVSPGDMGHAVGRALGEHGLSVIASLNGRSERTRELAAQGGIRDVRSLEEMVSEAGLVLSIVPPAEAVSVARQVAGAIRATGSYPPYADCNAVSPHTAEKMSGIVEGAGGLFIDASIIGPPPGRGAPPRLYVSGAHAAILTELDGKGIDVRPIGDAIGRASALKMCHGALGKGTLALYAALLTAAEALGLSAELRDEFLLSQPEAYERMETQLPFAPAKSQRAIAEMEEIAVTFDHVGVTPHMHLGAAEMYRLLSETPFARENPETVDRDRTLAQTISVLAESLPRGADSEAPTPFAEAEKPPP